VYWLSRLLLKIAALAAAYCGAILLLMGWPTSGVVALVLFIVLAGRRAKHFTTLGSARWAEERELRNAGMVNAKSGLIIGRLPPNMLDGQSAVSRIFDRRIQAPDAVRRFWLDFVKPDAPIVRLPQAVHTAVFAPTGAGKNVSLITPFLLTCPESVIVVDYKGENATLTAAHRAHAFGHRIVLLDPFKLTTQTPDTFNPLDFIAKGDPHALDECRDLAQALVVRTNEEKEPHWNDSAEAWIAAFLATIVHYG
jgi:type IV secretion system protein VirD4